jgi:hypothetical protein
MQRSIGGPIIENQDFLVWILISKDAVEALLDKALVVE